MTGRMAMATIMRVSQNQIRKYILKGESDNPKLAELYKSSPQIKELLSVCQNFRERGHPLAVGRAEFAVQPEFAPCAADHADADEHRLLDDDHDDRGHDELSLIHI